MGDGGGRRKKPKNGNLGVLLFDGAGELEYTEDPLIIDRTLLCSPPNREEDCDAGEPSSGVSAWSGRGDLRNEGIAIGI